MIKRGLRYVEEVSDVVRAQLALSGKLAYAPDVETAISMAIVHAARVGQVAA